MSENGMQTIYKLGLTDPTLAREIAQELRNAITPAAVAIQELDVDSVECTVCSSYIGGPHDCSRDEISNMLVDVKSSIDHVLIVIDALEANPLLKLI